VPQTVPQTVCETVSETVCETVSETVSETVCETVSETVCETVSETVCETVSETVCDTASSGAKADRPDRCCALGSPVVAAGEDKSSPSGFSRQPFRALHTEIANKPARIGHFCWLKRCVCRAESSSERGCVCPRERPSS